MWMPMPDYIEEPGHLFFNGDQVYYGKTLPRKQDGRLSYFMLDTFQETSVTECPKEDHVEKDYST